MVAWIVFDVNWPTSSPSPPSVHDTGEVWLQVQLFEATALTSVTSGGSVSTRVTGVFALAVPTLDTEIVYSRESPGVVAALSTPLLTRMSGESFGVGPNADENSEQLLCSSDSAIRLSGSTQAVLSSERPDSAVMNTVILMVTSLPASRSPRQSTPLTGFCVTAQAQLLPVPASTASGIIPTGIGSCM